MKKTGYFFFSFLPMLASLAMQFLIIIPLTGAAVIGICLSSPGKISYYEMSDRLIRTISSQTFTGALSLTYAIAAVCIFGIWYQIQFQGNFTKNVVRWIHPGLITGIVCIAPMLQIATGILTTGIATLFPGWMKQYTELMETAGLTDDPTLLLVLYAVIIGPIAEELTFRGVTLSSLKRVFPFTAANLIQALMFGIFHLNMIQGIYAFCIGIIFGYICEKSGCIWYSIFLHMAFNGLGVLTGSAVTETTSPAAVCAIYLVFIFLGILGMWLIAHYLPKKEN